MKNEFIGFYDPTKKEIDNAWKDGIFTFDASSILNLYRYTKSTRTDFLSVLNHFKKRLFIPHQAAFEFHSNRTIVISDLEKAHDVLNELINSNLLKSLPPLIQTYDRHPSISTKKINRLFDDFLSKVTRELNEQKKEHPDFKTNDKILLDVTELFTDCVGPEFSEKELELIYKEGRERYERSIPPGYKDSDKKNKGDRHVYGDLIVWKQLINYSKEDDRPLIFITDDRKEDWWTIQKGNTVRPREELIKEFFDSTGVRILIYQADSFLSYASEKILSKKLNSDTIDEVKSVGTSRQFILDSNSAFNNFGAFDSKGNLYLVDSDNAPNYNGGVNSRFGLEKISPFFGNPRLVIQDSANRFISNPTEFRLGDTNTFIPTNQASSESIESIPKETAVTKPYVPADAISRISQSEKKETLPEDVRRRKQTRPPRKK